MKKHRIVKIFKSKAFKRTAVIVIALIILLVLPKLMFLSSDKDMAFAQAEQGDFEVVITSSGELEAEKSIDIKGPVLENSSLNVGHGHMFAFEFLEILDLVPEGTIVSKGDYVAQLNTTDYVNRLKSARETLVTYKAERDLKKLDTALNLSRLRDNIQAKLYDIEKAKINVEAKQYEAPAVIKKAKQKLDACERVLVQLYSQYELKEKQAAIQMRNVQKKVADQELSIQYLEQYIADFTVRAPADGMIQYKKNGMGQKIKKGEVINPFENVVATLPDLSAMLSKTYIGETNITKLKEGQPVMVQIDAFPEKSYSGEIIKIANIGEHLSNSDSKVFEVLIKLHKTDLSLRPAMTTWNKIIINTYKDVVYVPLDCVYATSDRIPFVYRKNHKRQVVVLGAANDKNVVIEKGLKAGDMIYITPPEDANSQKMEGMELLSSDSN